MRRDVSDGTPDIDYDGMIDRHEFIAGTDPTNCLSVLALTGLPHTGGGVFVFQWQSVSNKYYRIERSTNLFQGFAPLTNRVLASPPRNTWTDTADKASSFFRIVVEE